MIAHKNMKIVSAEWTPVVNILIVECDCAFKFKCRADRWKVVCPQCNKVGNLHSLRNNIQPGDVVTK